MKAHEFFKAFWNLQSLHELNIPSIEKDEGISVRELLLAGAEKIFVYLYLRFKLNKIII